MKRAAERLGVAVDLLAPSSVLPNLTARRLLFNERLRFHDWSRYDVIVGFDMDGYRIAGRTGVRHAAVIKGVIADELQFERGVTRALLSLQAACERRHVRRADLVITSSAYSAAEIQSAYGLHSTPAVVPEMIELERWRVERTANSAFSVLCVGRPYPRKRIGLLVEAARLLAARIPGIEVRITGTGAAAANVRWLGRISFQELQAEYARASVFCLPSVQEGFGIVFLEAMAAGVPIVAARAAAVPEVVPQGVLVEPESAAALADAIERLYLDADERERLRAAGYERVKEYAAPRVAAQFLQALT